MHLQNSKWTNIIPVEIRGFTKEESFDFFTDLLSFAAKKHNIDSMLARAINPYLAECLSRYICEIRNFFFFVNNMPLIADCHDKNDEFGIIHDTMMDILICWGLFRQTFNVTTKNNPHVFTTLSRNYYASKHPLIAHHFTECGQALQTVSETTFLLQAIDIPRG